MEETSVGQEITFLSPEPTKIEKLRAIPWSLAYDITNTFFVQFTFFGSAFILFLNDLGLSKTQIGLLLAVFSFLGLLSLFIGPLVARKGYKRTFLTSFLFRNLFTAALLLTPLVAARFDLTSVLLYVTAVTVVFAISRAVAMTAQLPWQQEYIPNDIRGKYSAYSSIFVSLTGLIAVAVAGFVLGLADGLDQYMILIGLGVIFGVISIYFASNIPGGQPTTGGASLLSNPAALMAPLRDRGFVRYLTGVGLITLATGPVFSFLPLFMQGVVGLSPSNVVFLQTGSLLGSLLSSYFWGWLADRYGSKPIALAGLLMTTTLPVWWYLMPRESALSLPIALGIAFLQGVAGSGWGIGSGRLLFVSVVPSEHNSIYLSQYNAWMGLLGGISSVFGGRILDLFSGLQMEVLGFGIDAYTVLFAIGFFFSLISALILRAVQTEQEISVGKLAGLFIHGNPFLAVDSLIRFYFAKEETAVVAVTERLGQARSPLTVDELLESLEDPRFFVRFEAIVSIARHGADERLTAALVEALDGNDPAISVIAAWALGRTGDEAALPALRRSLQNSRYHSVQAHAARSLGTLGDEASIPLLLERIRSDADMGLKVACASALGKLRVVEETSLLLSILDQDKYPDSRKEVALGVARLVDGERGYIQLIRSLRNDPGTTLAQQMRAIKQAAGRASSNGHEPDLRFEEVEERFARGDVEGGVRLIPEVIRHVSAGANGDHCRLILDECAAQIAARGSAQMEYMALAVVVMDAVQQQP